MFCMTNKMLLLISLLLLPQNIIPVAVKMPVYSCLKSLRIPVRVEYYMYFAGII